MDADLLNSLLADCAVALAFVGLMASLATVSRHPALRGAVMYAAGHLGFAAGSSVFILSLGLEPGHRWLAGLEFAALIASVLGAAAMVDGMARLLDISERPKLTTSPTRWRWRVSPRCSCATMRRPTDCRP